MKKLLLLILGYSLCWSALAQFSEAQFTYQSDRFTAILKVDFDADGDEDIFASIGSLSGAEQLYYIEHLSEYGAFKSAVTVANEDIYIRDVAVADLNSDGLPDIIYVANNELGWRRNLGFNQLADFHVYGNATQNPKIQPLDFDNDGDLDLLLTNNGSTTLFELETGVLANAPRAISYVGSLVSAGTLDANGDGLTDIVGARPSSNQVILFLHQDTSFSDPIVLYEGENVQQVVVVDIDQDGDEDLVYADAYGSDAGIYWLRNQPGSGFDDPLLVTDAITIIGATHDLTTGDFNQDGRIDILSVNGQTYVWFPQLPDGTFGDSQSVGSTFSNNNSNFTTAIAIDVGLDGTTDFATVRNGLKVGIEGYLNVAGDGSQWASEKLSHYNDVSSNVAADLDNDGDLDLLQMGNPGIAWAENLTGRGTFRVAQELYYDMTTVNCYLGVANDLDTDGDMDAMGFFDDGIRYFENMGGGNIGGPQTILPYSSTAACTADFNGDGRLDFVSGHDQPRRLLLLTGNGGASFSESLIANTSTSYEALVVLDIDQQNGPDVVAFRNNYPSDREIVVFRNDGNGNFDMPEYLATYAAFFSRGPYLIDLDNNGYLDIVYDIYGSTAAVWLRNDGTNTLVPESLDQYFFEVVNGLTKGDIDNDGLDELIVSGADSLYYVNYQNGAFEVDYAQASDLELSDLQLVPINDYGGDDLLAVDNTSWPRAVWFNNLSGGNIISGQTFWDVNENGVFDLEEVPLANQGTGLYQETPTQFGDSTGFYSYLVEPGFYQLYCAPSPSWSTVGDSVISFVVEDTVVMHDFALRPTVNYTELSLAFTTGPTRCGFTIPAWLNYQNTGTQYISGYADLQIDPSVIVVDANPPIDTVTVTGVGWRIDSLAPTHGGSISLKLAIPGVDSIGAILDFITTGTVEGAPGNEISIDSDTLSSEITCAYDPNDKLVDLVGVYFDDYEQSGQELNYTIRFQNTGNDTAFTVRLEDQLDPKLDWRTLAPVSSSHPVTTTLSETGELTFLFENILLPDTATNWTGSQGYVRYAIRLRDGLTADAIIENKAAIYFDFNPPIITNTVYTTMLLTTIEESRAVATFHLYPNPTAGQVTVVTKAVPYSTALIITDLYGRRMKEITLTAGSSSRLINVDDWPSGLYLVTYVFANNRSSRKLVVR